MRILPGKTLYSALCEKSRRVPICGEKTVPGLDPASLYEGLYRECPDSFLFESGKGPQATARYSLMGASNSRLIQIRDRTTRLYLHGNPQKVLDHPDAGLAWLDFEEGVQPVDYLDHFWGGWTGYIGYEAAGLFEHLPPEKPGGPGNPDLYFMQVDRLIVYDHLTEALKVILSPLRGELTYEEALKEIRGIWDSIHAVMDRCHRSGLNESGFTGTHGDKKEPNLNGLLSNMSREDYMDRVQRVKRYIGEGDIYQANLAQRFETGFEGNPFDLYKKLKAVNPSPFSGFLKFKGLAIASSSPERLVKVDGPRIETRPIAGTRPRSRDPVKDRSLSTELLLNEKERAEHLMLVDLERNDLGRISRVGSVCVTDLMFLEQYSHVSHIVSNIVGNLRPGVSVKEILRAVFPGGTITGCPKVRCMEIIHELEPTRRGPYSGSFGYIGFSPHMDLNIIIRTILLQEGKAWFHVGAGIVADSSPEQEYQETLDKAAAMIEVLSPSTKGME